MKSITMDAPDISAGGLPLDGLAKTDWLRIALLFLAGLLAAAQFSKVALTLAQHAQMFGRDVASVAVLVSLTSVAGVIFGASAGMIVARFGARSMLVGALVLGGAVSMLQAAEPAYPVYFSSRLVEGFSHLVIVVAAPTAMIAAARTQDQGIVMGIWGMFFGVSFAVSAMIFPGLLRIDGLGTILAGHGMALWFLAVALWWRLPPGARKAGPIGRGLLAEHVAIYRDPHTVAPALIFLWHTLSFVALLTLAPPLMGWGGTALPLMSLGGTFLAGALSRLIDPLRLAILAFIASGGTAAALVVWPQSATLVVCYFCLNGLVPGASFAAIPALNASGPSRARASGALAQVGNIGTAFGTPFFAMTLANGMSGLFTLAACLCAVGALSIVLIHRNMAGKT
ncbi:MFS transporter [Oceaniglobus indicus]|uniref:MFS transporter n=1 Tax=Oceaniglobus indicus TaxID=2047749 RepID=UPI000C179FB8|nr:MFS transporter [Oceaniglobus indicus]